MEGHTILLVDDEETVLGLLKRAFSDSPYRTLTAGTGAQAIELLEVHPVSLIITDNKMPGMTGVELLSEARRRWPDRARLLITGYADVEAIQGAINEGWVHHFMTKPFDVERLRQTVDEIIGRFELTRENRRLSELTARQNEALRQLNAELDRRVAKRTAELSLKNNELEALYANLKRGLLGAVQMFSALLENYDETLGGHARRVASLARDLAARVGLKAEEVESIEIAARLHDIGLVCLPERIARATEQGLSRLNEQGRTLFRRHPEYGQQIVGGHEQFTMIGGLIRAHHERYDGFGYPDHLAGEAIPFGARIIAIASQYDQIVNRGKEKPGAGDPRGRRRREAIQYLRAQQGSGLDPHLTLAFLEMLGEGEPEGSTLEVKFSELRAGMVLAEGIASESGLLILEPGTTLQPFHLARLESFNRIDPIRQRILVRGEA